MDPREISRRLGILSIEERVQIIQSLLRLGSRDLSEEQREPFENAVRRIGAMAGLEVDIAEHDAGERLLHDGDRKSVV